MCPHPEPPSHLPFPPHPFPQGFVFFFFFLDFQAVVCRMWGAARRGREAREEATVVHVSSVGLCQQGTLGLFWRQNPGDQVTDWVGGEGS